MHGEINVKMPSANVSTYGSILPVPSRCCFRLLISADTGHAVASFPDQVIAAGPVIQCNKFSSIISADNLSNFSLFIITYSAVI